MTGFLVMPAAVFAADDAVPHIDLHAADFDLTKPGDLGERMERRRCYKHALADVASQIARLQTTSPSRGGQTMAPAQDDGPANMTTGK